MQRFSVLDLAPICEGQTATQALEQSRLAAQTAERVGYYRYWLAEHHNMPGIASAATAVVIGHIAGATRTIRVGAGGIMLPNHAPLIIAEQFGTLASLYPGRIDLGFGRAPGSDMATARALRRNMAAGDSFPDDVLEAIGYFSDAAAQARIQAVPGAGTHVPVWVLGSSLYGAQLAAYLGLPYAFASHFAPAMLDEAADIYRRTFRPSEHLDAPYFMMACGVVAAETDAEAEFLRSSQVLAFARLRSGAPGKLPPPVQDVAKVVGPDVFAGVSQALSCAAVGGPKRLREQLGQMIARYCPDEIITAGMIHDGRARRRSLEIAAGVLSEFVAEVSDPVP